MCSSDLERTSPTFNEILDGLEAEDALLEGGYDLIDAFFGVVRHPVVSAMFVPVGGPGWLEWLTARV